MRCDEFERRLDSYLRGALREPAFGEMVEHESDCAHCRQLASERQSGSSIGFSTDFPEGFPADSGMGSPHDSAMGSLYESAIGAPYDSAIGAPDGLFPSDLVEPILRRTAELDCRYMESRLAERAQEPIGADLEARLERHLAGCPSCRRVRDVLEELPAWYSSLSRVKPDRFFTRDVLARTTGRPPGFLEVARTLLRRPEAIWEAAAACALVSTLLFGHLTPDYSATLRHVRPPAAMEAGIRGVGESLREGIEQVRDRAGRLGTAPRQAFRSVLDRVAAESARASAWEARIERDVRAQDWQKLVADFSALLQECGLSHERPAGARKEKP